VGIILSQKGEISEIFSLPLQNFLIFLRISSPSKSAVVGVKAQDFADFCGAALIIKQGRHLSEDGLAEIIKIKNGMNKGRSY
jgi:hypothetical protein